MPSGKSKSKENTWTEKDLTDAIQGDKPRRSKDDRKQRESKEDRREKHSRDKGEEDRDRRRQKSEKHREEGSLDGEDSRRRSKDDDGGRKHKERMEDDGSSDRRKGRRQKERNGDDEHEVDRRRHRDKEESSRSKEKSRKHRENLDESSREWRDRDEGKKDKERNGEEKDDRRKHRDKDERSKERSRRHREDEMESSRERNDERKRDKERKKEHDRRRDVEEDHETERRRSKDERRREREREDGNRDKEKRERRRDKETDERHKDGRREKDEHRKERRRDRSPDESMRKKERRKYDNDEDEDDHERERRKRKQERREAKESNDGENDDRRTKDKKRSEEDTEDRLRRKEERRKKKEHDQVENEDERQRKERKDSENGMESNGKSRSVSNIVEVVEEVQDEDNYDDYEDDFEDYEDDFEDEDGVDEEDEGHEQDKGKLLEIFEAINAENDDIRHLPFKQASNDGESRKEEKPVPKPFKSEPHGRINFFAAKQKHVTEFIASKTRKRAQELKNLIELDVASYDIFDLPPLNEYELYIKSYGQSDSKQAYVQCHDDVVEKEIQTEVIEMCTKWTQYPPDDFKGFGEGDESREGNDLQDNVVTPHSFDSVKLSHFLQRASQVCLILLEEKISARKDSMFKERNDMIVSDGFIQLGSKLPFLQGRRVLDVKFNLVQTHLLLTAHDCNNDNVETNRDCLQGRGIVCYWNVNEPSQPQKILYCESSPNSCCFSPVKSSLVFAGLEDGSVVVWDIRESSSLHSTVNNKDKQWIVRRPTFSTAGVLNNDNHLGPVQNILPIALPIDSAQALSRSTILQDEPGGMAFQLASLDESGVVNIWVLIELDKPDEAGSENDLGLAPGGRVKLIKSTSIQVQSPHREMFVGCDIQASVMQFSTMDPNHFYVGTDRGWVVHCTRYGGKTHPKFYRPETDSFVTISAIDVSPWNIPVLLIGCADGSLRLHDLRKEYAIRSWAETTQGSAIIQLMWSKSRPSLFFVLDAKSNLYIWDLLQDDGQPIATESFKRGEVLYFSMSNDYESLGIGLPGRKSELVLNYEGGIIELHRLKENLTNVQADELDRFAAVMETII